MLRFGDHLLENAARRSRRCGPIVVALALAAIVFLLPAAVARAGRLALVTCDGSTASEGWSGFAETVPPGPENVSGAIAVTTCTQEWGENGSSGFPAGMLAGLSEETSRDARVGLRFIAPSGDTIVGGNILVEPIGLIGAGLEGGMGVGAQLATGYPENVFASLVNYEPRLVAIPGGSKLLSASVLCDGTPGQRCHQYLFVVGAHILLSPNAAPWLSALSGPLTIGGALHGTQDVSFTASDGDGPGIYEVTAAIDGNVVYQATPNLNGGACVSAGNDGGAFEFYTAYPCPQSVALTLPIHTSTLENGIHELTVVATDAARNRSNVSQVLFRTENLITVASEGRVPRPTNGTEPGYLVRFDGRTTALLRGVRRSYEHSSLTLSGTLTTPQSAAAPDVPVQLLAREGNSPSGTETVVASTSTNAAGNWSLTAPKGPSRTLRVGYDHASTENTQPAAGMTIKESVTPTMSLHIVDRRGGRFSFTGRMMVSPLARPLPIVTIEASADGRHWQVVGHQVRTDAQGDYRLAYSSPFSVGGHFAFRASTPETSLWLAGATPARWIRVR